LDVKSLPDCEALADRFGGGRDRMAEVVAPIAATELATTRFEMNIAG
jgi:hypothetical protein